MPLTLRQLDTRQSDVAAQLAALRASLSVRGAVVSEAGRQKTLAVFGEPLTPQQVVERICGEVRSEGLPAVLRYSQQLDQAQVSAATLRVSANELAAAHRAAAPELLNVVRRVRANILEFQKTLLPREVEVRRASGVVLRQRYRPLHRVGVCVPGGAAAYPSTVLMAAVPAQAAGVEEIAVIAPPTPFGANNPVILAVCHELGLGEVYRAGGAQGVAMLAYGVEGVAPVDKIVGPGNMFVALAKQKVYGEVDIDAIAGPSEVVVIADETTRPDFAAADLLAQAEHSPGASILISWSAATLAATAAELERQVARLARCELTRESLQAYGALILVRDEAEACALTNTLAPEHLHVAIENAGRLLERLPHAGAVFLGNYSPVALGDYVAGPSHVLPTGGTARWASGLSSAAFVRSSSVIEYTAQALAAAAPDVQFLAETEGLTAHRASIDVRLKTT